MAIGTTVITFAPILMNEMNEALRERAMTTADYVIFGVSSFRQPAQLSRRPIPRRTKGEGSGARVTADCRSQC